MPARTWVARRLAVLLLLVFAALLRAERGVAELQGRTGEPTRILRLAPASTGEWRYAFLGREGQVAARVILLRGDGPLVSLPAEGLMLQWLWDLFRGLVNDMPRALPVR